MIVGAIAVSACAGDTAIVLSIRAESSSASVDARQLTVYVGVGAAQAPAAGPDSVVEPRWWKRAPIELPADALTFPDGLGGQTYELALVPSADLPLGDELVFAVAAWSGADARALIGYAHAAAPARFAEGEIRRFDVKLTDVDSRDDGAVTATGCAWWRADPTDPTPNPVRDRAIVPAEDADCDDYARPIGPAPNCDPGARIDCDDADPATNPGAGQDCTATDTDCCTDTSPDASDVDRDGVAVCAGDCADAVGVEDLFGNVIPPEDINPSVVDDTCNGVDEACAIPRGGTCDPVGADPDDDHYVNCRDPGGSIAGAVEITTCAQLPGRKDCLEQGTVTGFNNEGSTVSVPAHEVHPDAEDIECDGIDQDCSRSCDDGDPALADVDGDGFQRCARGGLVNGGGLTCDPGETPADCDDDERFEVPEPAVEACDGLDSGCDSQLDRDVSALPCLPVVPIGSGATCQPGFVACAEEPDGTAATACRGNGSGQTIPAVLCRPCATAGTDPLHCTDRRFPECLVHTPMGAAGPACTNPTQVRGLAMCPSPSCTWQIVGGDAAAQFGGWDVKLIDPGNTGATAGSTLTASAASLLVVSAGAAPRGFVVRRTDLFAESFEIVVLRRDPNPGCGEMMNCLTAISAM